MSDNADEFTELFDRTKNDHDAKMIVGSEVRYIITRLREARADLTTLTRERDEARRDRDTLAAEVRAYRYHIADKGGEFFEMMRKSVVTWEHWQRCQSDTDTTGALNRAGGGA